MQQQNTIEFSELLFHACTLGYNWNQAHNILDHYYPCHGPRTISIDNANEEENTDAKKILKSFFKTSKVDVVIILSKVG
jgi:hypothetical protein